MSCPDCQSLVDIDDLSSPYVVRKCANCGREINLREPGDNGHGIKVEKGDRFVFPEGWLQISAHPLKGRGNLSRSGLRWFAKLIFVEDVGKTEDVDGLIAKTADDAESILRESALFEHLNLDDEDGVLEAFEIVKKDQSTLEWWAFLIDTMTGIAQDALKDNDAKKAVWAIRAAERFRAMCVFKSHLEEVVWMGHSAGRLVDILNAWYANTTNGKEQYWQQLFKNNPVSLTQLFAVPVVFVGDNAYVGGLNVDRQNSKFVDYLYANDSSNDAVLVELKTPVAKLLGAKYRKGVYKPSAELSGSVVQVLDYKRELSANIRNIVGDTGKKIEIFNPRCIVVIGDATTELDDNVKRKSFELYRTSLKDVEVVTFDELFRKAEMLAKLFNIVAKRSET